MGVLNIYYPEAKEFMEEAKIIYSVLNLEWSAKCLEENCLDFNKSALSYTEAKKQNQIPEIAYLRWTVLQK